MDLIIEFYKGLDTLNLIIFWGIIIVVVLLLLFSMIMISKNKQLKKIINSKKEGKEEQESLQDELPILKNDFIEIEKEKFLEPIKEESITKTIEEENNFIAEEHVMNYKEENIPSEKVVVKETPIKEEIKMPTGPYQRNVLREISSSQTSPIGIVKPIKKEENEIAKAKELHYNLNIENEVKKETNNNHIEISKKENPKEKYLEEVSRKLSSSQQNDIDRTKYEIEQEEEAIISYKELMEKKDSIKIIDEEEAVISIEELMNKKRKEEQIYNLTEDEENGKFIDELKNFRKNL